MKADIGIIGAMEPEIEALVGELSDGVTECVSGITFHIGTLLGKRVVIAKCGIGKVFAALCTEAMIIKYSPDLIVNTGVGGALVGLVSGINKIYFEADRRAAEILLDAASSLGLCARLGRIASGDKFVASAADKEHITGSFSADVCEMEGCAVAQVAFVNGTPFAVIRAISDSADGEATMDYPTFLPIAARNSAALTRKLVERW